MVELVSRPRTASSPINPRTESEHLLTVPAQLLIQQHSRKVPPENHEVVHKTATANTCSRAFSPETNLVTLDNAIVPFRDVVGHAATAAATGLSCNSKRVPDADVSVYKVEHGATWTKNNAGVEQVNNETRVVKRYSR